MAWYPRSRFLASLAPAVTLVLTSSAGGAPIFSQPPLDGGVSFEADSTGQIGDDFSLSENRDITSVRWWGGEGSPPGPVVSSFSIRFFEDNGQGAPEVIPFAEFAVTGVSRLPTGLNAFPGQPIFEYAADLPQPVFAAASTTYYLAIVAEATNWGWASSNASGSIWGRAGDGDPWIPRLDPEGDLAFELVPEPGTVALLGFGLLALAVARSRGCVRG